VVPQLSAPLDGPVSLNIPFSAESAGRVREALESWLGDRGLAPDVVDDIRLIATELVGNAVRHASPLGNGTVLVRWEAEDSTLALSVCDGGGSTEPEQVEAAPFDVGGRGLAIVDALSSKWWVEHTSQLHTVHVRLDLAADRLIS
jgi:anti-sigma regulatory factor (Ser/Thr protein kinase)